MVRHYCCPHDHPTRYCRVFCCLCHSVGVGQGVGYRVGGQHCVWSFIANHSPDPTLLTLQTLAIREIQFCVSRRNERNRLALKSKRDMHHSSRSAAHCAHPCGAPSHRCCLPLGRPQTQSPGLQLTPPPSCSCGQRSPQIAGVLFGGRGRGGGGEREGEGYIA